VTAFRYVGRLPTVMVELECRGVVSAPCQFLVDSGCERSLAPKHYARDFPWLANQAEAPTGLLGAGGHPLTGVVETLTVRIAGLGAFEETIAFGRDTRWGLLGQSRFFETFGVSFDNVPRPKRGRRFFVFPRRGP